MSLRIFIIFFSCMFLVSFSSKEKLKPMEPPRKDNPMLQKPEEHLLLPNPDRNKSFPPKKIGWNNPI